MNEILRQAMIEAGETFESLARAAKVNPQTAVRWYSQDRLPHPRNRVVVAARLGREVGELWPERRKQSSWLRPWLEVEAVAAVIRSYQPLTVPGLLQTPAYAKVVISNLEPDPEKAERLLAGRLERQRLLTGKRSPECVFVVDEAALRRGEPELLREQLARLVEVSRLPQVKLHAVPLSAGMYVGQSGSFVLATVEDRTVAYLEDQLEGRVVDTGINRLARYWEAVRSLALPADQTRDLIAEMVSEL